ncbi:synaptotagmin-1-like [Prorops nasuta]|uniref:synaptotagmin-1-like n=1 Tax=Prorops nasuta TaxID=863751 RepID=UPI0034CEB11C
MDIHGAGVVAVLGTVGAATGAISAVLVYTICSRRRRSTLLRSGSGPLNWFERDLLDRAEEAARSSKDALVSLGSGVTLGLESKISKGSDSRTDDEEWQFDHVFDSVACDSPRRNMVLQHLSESEDNHAAPISPIAPPLPEGAVAASEKRMVILRPPCRSLDESRSRLNSVEFQTCSRHKLSSSSSASSTDDSRGELQLSLMFNKSAGIVTVKLIEAHDLRARKLSGTADPYAKIRLLPDCSNIWQTRVHRRTLNPVFDEDFIFEVTSDSSLFDKTLEISLYDFDAFSRHRGLGYVHIPFSTIKKNNLCSWNNSESTMSPVMLTKPILYGAIGELKAPPLLMVSLSYQPSAEKLTIIIVRANNLPSLGDSANSTTCVKVSILHDCKTLKNKKSGTQRETTNPVWNDILSFDVSNDVLPKCSLEFSILQANGELIAKCVMNDKCQNEVFQRVLSGKGASAQWLPLSETENRRSDSTEMKD